MASSDHEYSHSDWSIMMSVRASSSYAKSLQYHNTPLSMTAFQGSFMYRFTQIVMGTVGLLNKLLTTIM